MRPETGVVPAKLCMIIMLFPGWYGKYCLVLRSTVSPDAVVVVKAVLLSFVKYVTTPSLEMRSNHWSARLL